MIQVSKTYSDRQTTCEVHDGQKRKKRKTSDAHQCVTENQSQENMMKLILKIHWHYNGMGHVFSLVDEVWLAFVIYTIETHVKVKWNMLFLLMISTTLLMVYRKIIGLKRDDSFLPPIFFFRNHLEECQAPHLKNTSFMGFCLSSKLYILFCVCATAHGCCFCFSFRFTSCSVK